ncbi:GatB/YqeY domain-containing protein [Priestia megaterium]|uniref:GatB/YqeY domain-containing protein n=1 Tax=Priestia megaterium TaxID=1404 RepID=UPI00211D7A6F|nr:GatB/YqeY domain-containing protein [Priestia megaterium]
MKTVDDIKKDMVQAMKDKNETAKSTLRMLLATLENEKVQQKLKHVSELSSDQVITCINRNIKQIDQEMEHLKNADRDTSNQEQQQFILRSYLPKQLTEAELEDRVSQIVKMTYHAGGNIGLAMKEITAKLRGQADMKKASEIARQCFAGYQMRESLKK